MEVQLPKSSQPGNPKKVGRDRHARHRYHSPSCADLKPLARQTHEILCNAKAEDNPAQWLSGMFFKGFQKPNLTLLYNQQQKSKSRAVAVYNICIRKMQNTEL